MPDAPWSAMVTVGRIVRPHGNRGHVVVESETDFADERFRPGAVLWTHRDDEARALTVAASRPYDGRWVIGFDGAATIDDAEAMRGLELRIPAYAIKPLEDGRYYVHDLTGCQVETVDGRSLGIVDRVEATGGPVVLVVRRRRGEMLIPFAAPICRIIDVAGRRIVIDAPEGLIDLND